jgi:hypothetical protein
MIGTECPSRPGTVRELPTLPAHGCRLDSGGVGGSHPGKLPVHQRPRTRGQPVSAPGAVRLLAEALGLSADDWARLPRGRPTATGNAARSVPESMFSMRGDITNLVGRHDELRTLLDVATGEPVQGIDACRGWHGRGGKTALSVYTGHYLADASLLDRSSWICTAAPPPGHVTRPTRWPACWPPRPGPPTPAAGSGRSGEVVAPSARHPSESRTNVRHQPGSDLARPTTAGPAPSSARGRRCGMLSPC